MQENNALEEVSEVEFSKKLMRMGRSESARQRRRYLKQIREMRLLNEWAKARRERKRK